MAALAAAAQLAGPPKADLAYLLYAAGSVLDGARLYVDVVEINPPLIVLLNMPAVLLARATGLSDILVYRALVIVALLGTVALVDWCLRRSLGPDAAPLRRGLVLVLAFALFLAAGDDFGQREHLLVALTAPYLVLAAGRANGTTVPAGAAWAAGIVGGLGLALKPQFLLLWVAVEGYVAWRSGVRRTAPGTLGVAAVLALYVTGIILVTPEYLHLVRLLGPVYSEYGRYPLVHVLITAPGTALCALAVLAWVALHREARHAALWSVLLAALVTGFLAGAAQEKGWGYHFYPARAFALALLALAVMDVRHPLVGLVRRLYATIAIAALGTTMLFAAATALARAAHRDSVRLAEEARLAELVAAVRRHAPPRGSLYVLSYSNESGFPLVNYTGVRWASRFPHLWILEAAYHDQLRAPAPLRFRTASAMGPAERYLNDAVYEDLFRYRPDILMVLRHARDHPRNTHRRIDYLGYFSREPRVAALLREYRRVGAVGEYVLYARTGSPDQPGTRPATTPGEYDLARPHASGVEALLSDSGLLLRLLAFMLLAGLGWTWIHREAAARRPGHERGTG